VGVHFDGGCAQNGGLFGVQAPFFFPTNMVMSAPRLRGRLTDWKVEKACGWVECLDAAHAGQRFFAHKAEFSQPWGDEEAPPEGVIVSFVLGTDVKTGKFRCQSIQVERSLFGQLGGSRQLGELVEWNAAKGCGWIQSKKGPRLFAHKTEFSEQFSIGEEPTPGTTLSFVVGVDKKSGRERACGIQVADGDEVADADAVADAGGGADSNERLYGTLDKWSVEKACGWISNGEDGGRPVFAHKSEFLEPLDDREAPPEGAAVSYVLGVDPKSGKRRAREILIASDAKRAKT